MRRGGIINGKVDVYLEEVPICGLITVIIATYLPTSGYFASPLRFKKKKDIFEERHLFVDIKCRHEWVFNLNYFREAIPVNLV